MGLGAAIRKGMAAAGSEYFLKHSSDPEWLESQLEKYLQDHLKQTNQDEFIDAFEKNSNIVDLIPAEDIELVKKYAKEVPENINQIKQNIFRNMNKFNRDWVMDWLFKNEPGYYQVMATHPEREKFENWLAAQIQNIGKFIAGFDV